MRLNKDRVNMKLWLKVERESTDVKINLQTFIWEAARFVLIRLKSEIRWLCTWTYNWSFAARSLLQAVDSSSERHEREAEEESEWAKSKFQFKLAEVVPFRVDEELNAMISRVIDDVSRIVEARCGSSIRLNEAYRLFIKRFFFVSTWIREWNQRKEFFSVFSPCVSLLTREITWFLK